MTDRQNALAGPFRFLGRHPDFRRFFLGLAPVEFGFQMASVTLGWQVYHLARETRSVADSAFLVGMVGMVQFAPLFLLTLFAGTLADRASRKGIVCRALAVVALATAGLTALSLGEAPSLPAIFALSALIGAARAFLQPAASAMAPMLVARTDMPQAISLNTLMWMGSVIIGPFFGGVLIAHSVALSYGVTTGLYLFGLGVTSRIRTSTTPERQHGHPLALLREGMAYVWNSKLVLGATSLDLFAVLLGGATALLPAFASDILKVGPLGFGLLRAGSAVGGLVVAAWLAWFPIRRWAGVKMFAGVAAFGLGTVIFGLSSWMPVSFAALVLLGAGDMISVNIRQTLVQIVTPDPLRGRVAAVSSLFMSGSNELGEFESGVVARLVGPVVAAVSGGIGTLIVTALWARWFPALLHADRLDGPER